MPLLSDAVAAAKQFEEAHGGKPLLDPDTGQEVFPDGTERKFSDVINGYLISEPLQPDAKLRGRRKYVALLLELEKRDFVNFKKECVDAANANANANYMNVPGPPANAKQLLEAGAQRIATLQENLAQLDREISQLPEELARQAYLDEQNRQAQARRQQALDIQSVQY